MQVRDWIHCDDHSQGVLAVLEKGRSGEVYNLGGGTESNASILECIQKIESLIDTPMNYVYSETPREGDHICYISNLTKLRSHFPTWTLSRLLDDILEELVEMELKLKPSGQATAMRTEVKARLTH